MGAPNLHWHLGIVPQAAHGKAWQGVVHGVLAVSKRGAPPLDKSRLCVNTHAFNHQLFAQTFNTRAPRLGRQPGPREQLVDSVDKAPLDDLSYCCALSRT